MRSKYNNRKTVVNDFVFDSRAEARRYRELKMLEMAGEIKNLELQPKFTIDVGGKHICNYFADFRYTDCRAEVRIVEDVKSSATKTPVYRLKRKLMLALYGIEIVEVE